MLESSKRPVGGQVADECALRQTVIEPMSPLWTNPDTQKYAAAAAKLLSRQIRPYAQPSPDPRRDALIAGIALAIAARARRRKIAYGAAVAALAAASIAATIGLASYPPATIAVQVSPDTLVVEMSTGRGNTLRRSGGTMTLQSAVALRAGDDVHSSDEGHVGFVFSGGARVLFSPGSDVKVDELGTTRRLLLLHGRLEAHVPKLGEKERFIVGTPDSEVEVRGTQFTVEVSEPLAECRTFASKVFVTEGAVSIRARDRQFWIYAGEAWTLPCKDLPISGASAFRPNHEGPQRHRVETRKVWPAPSMEERSSLSSPPGIPSSNLAAGGPPSAPVSHLDEQNDLFSSAMAAERQSKHEQAIRSLDELIERFPGGPLVESARAERQRLLLAGPPRQ